MNVTITRGKSSDVGTFGVLKAERGELVFTCYTGELPWRRNERSVSCIPVGVYDVTRYVSQKFGHVYLVNDVPGRSGILIHPANHFGKRDYGYKTDVEGCIGLGMKQDLVEGQLGLLYSRHAVEAFEYFMSFDGFRLSITEVE